MQVFGRIHISSLRKAIVKADNNSPCGEDSEIVVQAGDLESLLLMYPSRWVDRRINGPKHCMRNLLPTASHSTRWVGKNNSILGIAKQSSASMIENRRGMSTPRSSDAPKVFGADSLHTTTGRAPTSPLFQQARVSQGFNRLRPQPLVHSYLRHLYGLRHGKDGIVEKRCRPT
ncbi:hypothetical protein LIA77_01566 [Sarocladium implicatum]|nr:hypothetical protein LIA77_01566 [Sarocladium implicatum]